MEKYFNNFTLIWFLFTLVLLWLIWDQHNDIDYLNATFGHYLLKGQCL